MNTSELQKVDPDSIKTAVIYCLAAAEVLRCAKRSTQFLLGSQAAFVLSRITFVSGDREMIELESERSTIEVRLPKVEVRRTWTTSSQRTAKPSTMVNDAATQATAVSRKASSAGRSRKHRRDPTS